MTDTFEMSDELPSWDDAVSQEQDRQQKSLPTWEEAVQKENPSVQGAFGNLLYQEVKSKIPFIKHEPKELSEAQRLFVQKNPLKSGWNVVKAFGHGYADEFKENSAFSDETREWFVNAGMEKDYLHTEDNLNKAFIDGTMLPIARQMAEKARAGAMALAYPATEAANTAFTAVLGAPYAGYQEGAVQVGRELGSEKFGEELAAMPEAFAVPDSFIPHDIAIAKANRVLDGEAVYFGTKEPSLAQAKGIEEAAAQIHAPKVQTVHEIAREIAPETFSKYDELTTQRDTLRAHISDMAEQRHAEIAPSLPHTEEIAALQEKLTDATPRMTKKYQAQIDDLTTKNNEFLTENLKNDTPEMADLRDELQKIDYRMRDMSPEVSKAYRDAESRLPPEEAPTIETALPETGNTQTFAEEAPVLGNAAPLRPIEEQRAFIVDDFVKRATEVGSNAEEAGAVAQLEAARYETLSQLYPKFDAQEWYTRESANFKEGRASKTRARELAQKAQGKIRLATDDAKATITLFKTSNASTLIHEKGHEWIDQLLRLSDMEDAPAAMKADAAAVRKWGGAAEDGVLPTKGHEKFARSFERYLMEGVAPSKELAGVFAKFKQWLTAIYQTVERLKSPITDDIRDLFDRLLSTSENKVRGTKILGEDGYPLRVFHGTDKDFKDFDLNFAGKESNAWGEKEGFFFSANPENAGKYASEYRNPEQGANIRPAYLNIKNPKTIDVGKELNNDAKNIRNALKNAKKQGYDGAILTNFKDVFEDSGGTQYIAFDAKQIVPAFERTVITADELEKLKGENPVSVRGAANEVSKTGDTAPVPAEEAPENAVINAERATDTNQGSAADSGNRTTEPQNVGAAPSKQVEEPQIGPATSLGMPESNLVDKAGNIRLDNLNTPEDINEVLRQTAAQNNDFIGARRGVISDAQVSDLADALGMNPQNLSMRTLGQAFNAEQIVAARKLLIQSATEVRDFMNKAATGDETAVMAYAESKARHLMIQEQVSGVTAEAGRALRAFRELEGSKEAQALGDFLKTATGKDLFQLQEEARLGAKLDTAQQVSKFIQDSQKPKFSDMMIEFWINSLLSGPMTHVKNILGNTAVSLLSVGETGVAAGIGKIREFVGDVGEKVEFGEANARLFGVVQGGKDGLIAGIKAFTSEEMTGAHTLEQARYRAIPNINVKIAGKDVELGGKQIRIPSRALAAEDELFKAIAYRQELNAQAYRTATKEGLKGDAFNQRLAEITMNPSDEIMEAAVKNSEYQTFTKRLGDTGEKFQKFSNAKLFGFPLPKIWFPFIRTPVNILKYAGERTPLGLFADEVRANLSGANGRIAQDTQIARISIGTAIGATSLSLAAEGKLTGGGPSNPQEKAMWRLAGNQPYSVKIGDMWYSYAWGEPIATIMGISADMADIASKGTEDDQDLQEIGSMIFASISKNLMSKLSLRGASELIQAVADPDRYGESYVQNLVGTLVPSFVAQVARTEDPVMRQARSVLDAMKARIPGQRETLFPVRDIWGEPIVREGNLGPDAFSPIYEQRISKDPVNQILLKLNKFPAKPDRKIRDVELTDKQYDDYARISGRMAKIRLNSLVSQPGFQQMPDFAKIKIIDKILAASRENGRNAVLMKNPDIVRQARQNKLRELRGEKH